MKKRRKLAGTLNNIFLLAMEAKDHNTKTHSERVAEYAEAIAKKMKLSPKKRNSIKTAALLHDIGLIEVSVEILRKPERLTEEEIKIVRQHPFLGAKTLRSIEAFSDVVPAVRHHHEWWDGNGYPHGLKGNRIPLSARIIGVAEAFDAMTSDRPYRKARSKEEAIAELKRYAGRYFDPKVVKAFLETISTK